MEKQKLVDGFNTILNNAMERQYEKNGAGRYFSKQFFDISNFEEDPELYTELVAFIKSLNGGKK